jgi:hypothetical protein
MLRRDPLVLVTRTRPAQASRKLAEPNPHPVVGAIQPTAAPQSALLDGLSDVRVPRRVDGRAFRNDSRARKATFGMCRFPLILVTDLPALAGRGAAFAATAR